MRTHALVLSLALLSQIAGCAETERHPRTSAAGHRHRNAKPEAAPRDGLRVTRDEADGKLVVRVKSRGPAGREARVLERGAEVASTPLEDGGAKLLLGPGTYEIQSVAGVGDQGEWLGDVTVVKSHCFHESGGHDKPSKRVERLFGFEHGRARLLKRGNLRLPRLVAYYGIAPKTHVEWFAADGSSETTEEASSERRDTWIGGASPEAQLSDYLWHSSSSQHDPCRSLWTLVDDPLQVPERVWSEPGAWTARVVTAGGQVLEVALNTAHPNVERSSDEGRVITIPLDVHVVTPIKRESAFLAAEEARVTATPPTGQYYANAKPIPLDAALIRAAYREPAFVDAYSDFAIGRMTAAGGTIDRGASLVHGVQRGESVASIEQAIATDQARMDASQSDENAYRRAETARLRPILEGWVKKSGGPLAPSDFPAMYPASSE